MLGWSLKKRIESAWISLIHVVFHAMYMCIDCKELIIVIHATKECHRLSWMIFMLIKYCRSKLNWKCFINMWSTKSNSIEQLYFQNQRGSGRWKMQATCQTDFRQALPGFKWIHIAAGRPQTFFMEISNVVVTCVNTQVASYDFKWDFYVSMFHRSSFHPTALHWVLYATVRTYARARSEHASPITAPITIQFFLFTGGGHYGDIRHYAGRERRGRGLGK